MNNQDRQENLSNLDDSGYGDDSDGIDVESRDEIGEIKKMSLKETTRVRTWRYMVGAMLAMTGAVTVTAYIFLNREENQNFETAYYQFARTLGDAAVEQQQTTINALKGLSTSLTAYSQRNNLTWPYVVVPLFEALAKDTLDLCDAEFLGVNNIVKHEKRESFINFTTQHYQEWFEESHLLAYGNTDLLDTDPSKYNQFVSRKTKDGSFVPDIDREYYSVRTSQSPPPRAYGPTFNLNIASLGGNAKTIDGVLKLRTETLVTPIKPFNALPEEEHKNFHSDSEADHPHSFMYHPIYEKVKDSDSEIVGTVTAAVAWDASMRNLLPENVKGIVCVVRNNCNQTFSYEVDGPDAYFIGNSDLHDMSFNEYEVVLDLSVHNHPGFATTSGQCQYAMHIFPSKDFKEEYMSVMPETFAAVVAAAFVLVALVFVVYDMTVQNRNKKIVTDAAKSNAIVTSLFPGDMRERVLEQQNVNTSKSNKSSTVAMTFHNGENGNENDKEAAPDFSPLAKSFPHTTLMFADLAGFTAWSSSRTPSEVFELLETLYCSFDTIAAKLKVFKVETVGDCYVAAAGVPDPEENHAAIMARFASDCMVKMRMVIQDLVFSLGEDTAELQMRVGLHSGPVTGGVLRGQKSRFQLFGDTMNVAARMESNGARGRIHVSQATADELVKKGKGDWVTPREEKIIAKGKGEMQTYWVTPSSRTTTSVASKSLSSSANSEKENEEEEAMKARLMDRLGAAEVSPKTMRATTTAR